MFNEFNINTLGYLNVNNGDEVNTLFSKMYYIYFDYFVSNVCFSTGKIKTFFPFCVEK